MTRSQNRPSGEDGEGRRPPRRRRYTGTHPRRLGERYKELNPEAYPGIHEHVRARGDTPAGTHVPIMLPEVMDRLRPAAGETVADCTVGYGGHAVEFMRRVGPTGRLVGLDVDARQLDRTRRRLADGGVPFRLHRSHFAGIGKVLAAETLDGFDVIFADLGVSSMQIDDPSRGFSYKQDGPLDMRMDDRLVTTAADLLMSMSEQALSDAFLSLADEPDHEAIARRIVRQRAIRPIVRTTQLTRLVFSAKGLSRRNWRRQMADRRKDEPRIGRQLHPAARTFQALRILVNDELAGLEQFLRVAPYCLRPGGRIGIISFHSGEHRRIDDSFREGHRMGLYGTVADGPLCPGPQERRANPRSASARFRWAVRTSGSEV